MPTRTSAIAFALLLTAVLLINPLLSKPKISVPKLSQRSVKIIRVAGLPFKDLNKNGVLDPYEDWRKTPQERAADLLKRMNLDEKVGVMMHGTAPAAGGTAGMGSRYDLAQASRLIHDAKVNTFITRVC